MTRLLFALVLATVICSGILSVRLPRSRFIVDRFPLTDRVEPGSASIIAIMFALFLAFGMQEVKQRSNELSLAVQNEINVVRSILKFTESVGQSAGLVRQSLIEYLQAVTALEQDWLEHPRGHVSSAQEMADTIVKVATLFAAQHRSTSTLNALIISKVDALRVARTARISLSLRSSGLPQWVVLALIACITQFVICLGYLDKPRSNQAVVGLFTAAAVTAMCYLAWIDGLIGLSKIPATIAPFGELLAEIGY